MIVYVKNPTKSTKQLLELVSACSKFAALKEVNKNLLCSYILAIQTEHS